VYAIAALGNNGIVVSVFLDIVSRITEALHWKRGATADGRWINTSTAIANRKGVEEK
jgi:hypothetical protein